MDVALRVGADDNRHGEVNQALRRISRDAEQGRERGITFAADRENLVWDLAGALESRFSGRRGQEFRNQSGTMRWKCLLGLSPAGHLATKNQKTPDYRGFLSSG
jgi:hypothetical protein